MKVKKIIASALSVLAVSGTLAYPNASVLSEAISNTEITAQAYDASSTKTYNGFVYYEYDLPSESQARIVDYTGNAQNLTIPSTINGRVVIIDSRAFMGCTSLKNVTVSEGIPVICDYAFANCTNLETINLPSSLENIFPDSFKGCNKLKFTGPGVPVVVDVLSSMLLLDFGEYYRKNMTEMQKYQVMRNVAIKLHDYLTYDGSAPNQGDAASVLNTLKATCGGYSRVYYHLGLAAGLTKDEIKVVGDFHCHAWNYIKISGKWYNVDVTNSIYFNSDTEYAKNMFGNTSTSHAYHTYSKWYNVEEVYYGDGAQGRTALSAMGLAATSPRGDANGDGVVNVSDAVITNRFAAGTWSEDQINIPAADANRDGVITKEDGELITRLSIGLE